MNAHEWVLLAQAAGVAGAAAVLALLLRGRVSRQAVVTAIALIVVGLGAYNVALATRTGVAELSGVREHWVSDGDARAQCIADASDQQWRPLVAAARARLRDGGYYAVVGPHAVDSACLQLQLLPALGVEPEDRRARVLIAMGPVPGAYRGLPAQRVDDGALIERR